MGRSTLEFFSENDWSLILAKSKRLSYEPGEEIIKQGIPGKAIYIIRRGTASVEVTNLEAKPRSLFSDPKKFAATSLSYLKTRFSRTKPPHPC